MDASLRMSIWNQFGAAIDTLEAALRACPDPLWHAQLWEKPSERPEWAQFWYIAYHTLFWLDYYLTGSREGFTPPAPFTLDELDPAGVVPDRPYTREELLGYLAHGRSKCRATIEALTDETMPPPYKFSSGDMDYIQLLLYNMRHVQEHAAQLNLFLGQRVGSAPGWIGRARS